MTRTHCLFALRLATAGLLAVSAAPAWAEAPGPLIREGFKEDFSHLRLDNRRWYISDGWSNGDWMDCKWSRDAVSVAEGHLRLAHIPADAEKGAGATCGEVQSKGFAQYGTIEARIRTPRASGLNASVFTYAGPVHGAQHDEIDIEILTRDTGEITFNTYVDGKPLNGGTAPVQPPLDEEFHTVAMQWEPERITWFLDGRQVHQTEPGTALPDGPQKIYMSFWSTGELTDWMGRQGPRTGPLTYEVDWLAYTPLGHSCLFPESVIC